MPRVVKFEATPLAIELSEPFGIATGTQLRADNVLLRLELEDGSFGLGEAAPFPAVNAETQVDALAALAALESDVVGLPVGRWRLLEDLLAGQRRASPSACCAVETAVFDAWARQLRTSLWRCFGGRETTLTSDITIPTGDVAHAERSARQAAELGYELLKIKVGQDDWQSDAERLRAVAEAAPNSRLLLDGNAALTSAAAIELCRSLGSTGDRVVAFEQPTASEDLDGLGAVAAATGLPIIADESARTAADVIRLVKAGAAQAVNVKVTKSGVIPSLDMIAVARAAGLELMIGGMVESELCMSFSACLAAGSGGFRYVDLDTPLFLRDSPFRGGFARNGDGRGPRLDVGRIELGHGVTPRAS